MTNNAVMAWEKMRCYHFELNDTPGVYHVLLPAHLDILRRLLTHLQQPRSVCR